MTYSYVYAMAYFANIPYRVGRPPLYGVLSYPYLGIRGGRST